MAFWTSCEGINVHSLASVTGIEAVQYYQKKLALIFGREGAVILIGLLELPRLEDDQLPIAEVGSWSEQKYRLVGLFAALFLRAMREKWDALVYLDLFSGPGYARFKGTNYIVAASPLTVLELPEKFDQYIFCEEVKENADALDRRCSRDFPDACTKVIPENANNSVQEIIDSMPQPRRGYSVLGFCFLDPFKMRNLQFTTIEDLAQRYMDFLVLIPSGMDANRNKRVYTSPGNQTVDSFVGNSSWRARWQEENAARKSFEIFIVEEFGRSMNGLSYIDRGLESAAPIRSDDRNLLLYRLALYSRHALGNKFWQETRKYTDPQIGFSY
jgi:three-Cys-motif partner protein